MHCIYYPPIFMLYPLTVIAAKDKDVKKKCCKKYKTSGKHCKRCPKVN